MEILVGALAVLIVLEGFGILLLWQHIRRLYGMLAIQADLGGQLASALGELVGMAKGPRKDATVSQFPRDVSKPPPAS